MNRLKVLASGVFDLLHYGHIKFLEEARSLGYPNPRLVVIVASDETVTRNKGKPPVMPQSQRRALVEALKVVDEAVIGSNTLDMEAVIDTIKPDIIAVGHDQLDVEKQARIVIAEKGYGVRVERIGKFGTDGLDSSSKIKKRIVEESGTRA